MEIIQVFTSANCSPCKSLKKMLAQQTFSQEIEYIDIDENIELAAQLKVRALPTLIYKGKKIEGNVSYAKLKKEFDL